MPDRFFADTPLGPGAFTLDGPEAHHLAQVLRAKPGLAVVLFNGDGLNYPGIVEDVSKKRIELTLGKGTPSPANPTRKVHIACAMPKADRGDFLVEKLTELGATDFTPLITERSIVLPKENRLESLRRQAIEACKQCGRSELLTINEPEDWGVFRKRNDLPPAKWLLHPTGSALPILGDLESVVVAVGPEGGFTDKEVTEAEDWLKISLGARVLRIETAAITVMAKIN